MDNTDDPAFPKGARNGTSTVGTTESPGVTDADPPTADAHAADPQPAGMTALRPGFLAELAVAMRLTAERERERIAGQVADDATTHIEKVRARAAIETDELRRLAEEDVQRIEEWSSAEMERIRSEADQKIEDRRASLAEYLKQHDSIIETEINGVDTAVRDYSLTLDAFFLELSEAGDPAAIVSRAEELPAPPDLDQVRAQARASAVAMFADQEDDPAPEAMTAADATAVSADTAGDAVAESAAESPGIAKEVVADTEPMAQAGAVASSEDGERIEARADGQPTADPVPVMDPAATADPTWPAPEPEPVEVAATADHTSAAVRLLRSVAPWTAPTHAGSDRQETDPDR